MLTTLRNVISIVKTVIQRDPRKAVLFGVIGAVGCLLGALFGEVILALMLPSSPTPAQPRVDVVFVLDVTGSMEQEINGVRTGIQNFANSFSQRSLDIRYGVVAYRDNLNNEAAQVLRFSSGVLTDDPADFSRQVAALIADGGGDDPESAFDALALAADQPLRSDATRILLLITDAQPHIPDARMRSAAQTADYLVQQGIDQFNLVVPNAVRGDYSALTNALPGDVFTLSSTGRSDFDVSLAGIGESIAQRTATLIGSADSSQSASPLVATALWTTALALGISLALIGGQNYYMRRPLVQRDQVVRGIIGGAIAGFIAGLLGQLVFGLVSGAPILFGLGRVIGWGLLGMLLAWAMIYFIPNLRLTEARIGGFVGGVAGAVAFGLLSIVLTDTTGRLAGAALLGFFIGMMVAIVEVAFREAWLEVAYGPKEIRTISLGRDAITFGNNPEASTVVIPSTIPVAYRYQIEEKRIVFEDVARSRKTPVMNGHQQAMGSINVTVRTS
jgi:Ca-activated chloride channel family protein